MSLKASQLHKLAAELDKRLSQGRVTRVFGSGENLYYCNVSKAGRLYFALDGQDPRVYLSDSDKQLPPSSAQFALSLKKNLANSILTHVEQINGDRVLAFHFLGLNEVFHETEYTLIAELIPTKANLILLDEGGNIEAAHRYLSLTEKRPIVKGMKYEPPAKTIAYNLEDGKFDFDQYCASCLKRESELAEKAMRQKYAKLFSLINNKAKSSKRKIMTIQGDIEKAKQHANDGQYGTFIFTNMDSIDLSSGKLDFYGQEIPLDKSRSLSDNAEQFFKRQKKAKAALAVGQSNLDKATAEAIRYQELQAILPHCAEEGLRRLSEEFGCMPLAKSKKKAGGIKVAESLLPYEIKRDGVTYWFGKSARENDFLSFALDTDKNHIWMHVKDTHGAHLIIRKANPSNEELTFGCEICLLASGLSDGEVMYCEKNQVRKGNIPGQAIVKEYRSATFRSISKQAKEAYAACGRVGK